MLLLKLAFRNMLRQKRRSLLTGLSMTGGYILFSYSLALLLGSYGNVIEIFTLDRTGHIQIHADNYLKRPKIYKTVDDMEKVGSVLDTSTEVTSWTGRVFAPALAYAGDKTTPVSVTGIDPVREPTVSRVADKLTEGEFFNGTPDADGYFQAMIGFSVAQTLEIGPGDEIVLISQGADGSIANDIYMITGVIGNRNASDRNTVYLPLGAGQEFLALGSRVHEVAMLVADPAENEAVAAGIGTRLPGLTVSPWQKVEETFYRTMESDKQGNYFTMGLIVFLVFVGVLNTVVMSVLERTQEFGVLRAIGSRPGNIINMICLETTMMAALSCLVGIVIAMPLNWWFANYGIMMPDPIDMGGVTFQHMKGEFSPRIFLIPLGFMLGTAVLISILPGIRAARISPREALGSH